MPLNKERLAEVEQAIERCCQAEAGKVTIICRRGEIVHVRDERTTDYDRPRPQGRRLREGS